MPSAEAILIETQVEVGSAHFELNIGVGIGLRLFLPIGALTIDYGFPVVEEWDHLDGDGRVHFNLGYTF